MAGRSELLAPWLTAPATAGVLTDFDGTLSPIVEDPGSARPLDGVPETLSRLARRYRLVAVISGRPVAYLQSRLGEVPGVALFGLYGLEKGTDGDIAVLPSADRWRGAIDAVAAAAETEARPGVLVERKGLAVTLHFRTAPDEAEWVRAWAGDQAERRGLLAHPARMSVEVLPPVGAGKGDVVARVAGDLEAVCFIGDDVGDVPAFDALARLAEKGVHTLAVAVRSDETPGGLLERADLVVDGPEGALDLLRALEGRSAQ